ncbi:methyl-accepting chemotaxis protein [Bacillus sp. EB600]|uniref:methyl-accepting chemotaxis protein n=1 Tax=Bacillus sp. EB600 TaxID=2806345 RepID=UPI0021089937|nr:methyl-accepting chemotaxis protein [Bacillus sp. EB600]MCQ6281761.1 HAMP domain-containing protein [Bacillus sp. EB600]
MERKQRYKFSLKRKLVLFTVILAAITYTASAIFIYVVYPFVKNYIDQMTYMTVVLLLGVIWSGILAFVAAGFIVKPLKIIEAGALKAADGQICEDVITPESDDEIRSLGVAFNHMLSGMRAMVSQIQENFQETDEKVVSITEMSEQAARQAEIVSRTISEIAMGADSSASSVLTMVESIEEVTQIAKEVQAKAQASESVSSNMVQELKLSKDAIQSLVSGMERTVTDNRESMDTVKRLETNAAKVEQIIQLVGDIASQTNLLALNASIEAARAGEHGKGFAVVAKEVRKLADESSKAVQGISELIKNIQMEVHNVVQQMEAQVERANNEAEKGNKTNDVIEGMTAAIHNMEEMVKSITELVNRQMDSIEHASTQSQEVAAIAEQTSAGAQEVAASTTDQVRVIDGVENLALELKDQAEKLKETIKRFSI